MDETKEDKKIDNLRQLYKNYGTIYLFGSNNKRQLGLDTKIILSRYKS